MTGLPLLSFVERFPRPEFESGHALPSPTTPHPPAIGVEYVDLLMLGLVLSFATYLVLRRRRRRELLLLTCFALLYFGFWRRGCVCPVGSLQNVVLGLAGHGYIVPVFILGFFALPLVATLLFGRTFCAAVCPLGAIQDVVTLRPVRVPPWLAHALGLLPHVYLGTAVLLAATGAGFIVCRFDPFVGFFRVNGSYGMLLFGGALLLGGVFIGRPYCRFLCPYGVLLAGASRLSRRHATITPDECIQCRLCENACPYGAIRAPSASAPDEPRAAGRRRLALLLGLCPLLVLAGLGAGTALHGPLSRLHFTVQLAEQIGLEEAQPDTAQTLQSERFRTTGTTRAALFQAARTIRGQFRLGSMLLGAYLGLILGGKLVGLSVRRRRDGYTADRAACFSCGRCFEYCPKEHQRRAQSPLRPTSSGVSATPSQPLE